MNNKRVLYLFIAMFTYLVIISFPTYLFTNDIDVIKGVELGLRLAYLVFIVLFSFLSPLRKRYTGKTRLTNLFLLLPLFFVAFMNIFYLGVVTRSSYESVFVQLTNDGERLTLILTLITVIITSIEEEFLFRYVVQRNLSMRHKMVRILVSSAFYAVSHVFIILYNGRGIINPWNLFSVLFAFGVGIILGILYEYTNNLTFPIIFNIIYSVCSCNDIYYKPELAQASTAYYLTISLFFVGAAVYILIFYFFMLKRENR